MCLHYFNIRLYLFINQRKAVLKYWTHGSQNLGCHSRSHFSVKLYFRVFKMNAVTINISHNTTSAGLVNENDGTSHRDSQAIPIKYCKSMISS